MKIPTPTCQPVKVEWIDSASDNTGWNDATKLAEEFKGQRDGGCVRIISAGLLFLVTETTITLVQSNQPSQYAPGSPPYRVSGAYSIPRVAIRRIRELR